jgi:hypothetical protein
MNQRYMSGWQRDLLRRLPYTLEVLVNKIYVAEILHFLRKTDELQSQLVPVTSPRKISPYQSHTLSVIAFCVFHNVPACNPLGDHDGSSVRGVFQSGVTNKPQDIRVIQRLP